MITDTHIHIWDFQRAEYAWLKDNTSILNRTYAIEELEEERKDVGITTGVLVQAANNFEDTDWMLTVAAGTDWIKGVVGWLPLTDPETTQKALEEKYGQNPLFKGVRHLIHDEADPGWLLQPAVLESLHLLAQRNIPFDVVGVLPVHIRTALRVAEQVPELRMVFDHLNQPPISQKEKFGEWGELMRTAAGHPNFYAKISGLGTASGDPGNWNASTVRPYVEFVLEQFGVIRCFCGGDWPVSLLAGSYTKTWNNYKEIIDLLSSNTEKEQLLYSNAKRFYSL